MAALARIERPKQKLKSGQHRIYCDERRRIARIPTSLAVLVESETGETVGMATDLGIGGVFVSAADSPAYGTVVHVHIAPPDVPSEVRLQGVVRWITELGFGIQFDALGARETHTLSVLLEEAGGRLLGSHG